MIVIASSAATSFARNRANGAALPLLHPELQQIAREHEEQRGQQREVDREQRVEQDVGEQRRRDLGGPVRQARTARRAWR